MTSLLHAIQDAIASTAERIGPSLVGLGRGWGRGSGVIVTAGQVLTNAHVLRGDEVAVTFGDGEMAHGRVAGVDRDLDLAVITVSTGARPPIRWEPEAVGGLGVGSVVFALANPGGRGARTTFGTVSSTSAAFRGRGGRRLRGSLEHTAPLPRGSSGGPLVDAEGRLLGLNTVRLDGGFILALPADEDLRRRADALARGEAAQRPRLGVALAPPRAARRLRAAVGLPERDGLLVRGVEDDSPAQRAGIERGDLLVAVGGRELGGLDDLFDALEPGAGPLSLRVVRGTEERDVEVAF